MSPSVSATKCWRQWRDDENGFQFYSLKKKNNAFDGDAGFLICVLDLNIEPVWRSIQLPAHPVTFNCVFTFFLFSWSFQFFFFSQIKAEDSGDPPLWSTVKLHVEWIRKPVPSPLPLVFTQRLYNFSVSETAAVAQPVGVVAVSQSNTPVWFNIIGKMINTPLIFQSGGESVFKLNLNAFIQARTLKNRG